MRVLIACEFSGVVREAFRSRGHYAVSCDFLPSEIPGPHVQGDVCELLGVDQWDLLIAHPPCTHLSVSGARYWAVKRREQDAALEFIRTLLQAPVPRIALENPVGAISSQIRPPDQIVQPWEFGDDASKATCLWLKQLPPLLQTCIPAGVGRVVGGRERWANQTDSGQNRLAPSADRWKNRSRTYPGIADAMAAQWGGLTP